MGIQVEALQGFQALDTLDWFEALVVLRALIYIDKVTIDFAIHELLELYYTNLWKASVLWSQRLLKGLMFDLCSNGKELM